MSDPRPKKLSTKPRHFFEFLFHWVSIIFVVVALLFALLESVLLTELPVKNVALRFGFRDNFFYSMGFVLVIVIGFLLCDHLLKRKSRFYNKLFIYRCFLPALVVTMLIILYSNFLFPIYKFNQTMSTTLDHLNAYRIFLETLFSFSILVLAGFVFNIVRGVKQKLGNKVLLNFIIGKYRQPIQEEEIFLFLDLTDSTFLAEKMGYEKYAYFLQDYYLDIGLVIEKYKGNIYQYVGDEIVITWSNEVGVNGNNSINCFFACLDKIHKRETFYKERYGFMPSFKGGIHSGSVMVAEIGYLRNFVSYIGDTINTTAHIMSKCNEFNKKLLISKDLWSQVQLDEKYEYIYLGDFQLKGKEALTGIYAVGLK